MRWQDVLLVAGFGLTTVVALKVFLGNNHNGNGHANGRPPRNGARHPPMMPPGYMPPQQLPPGYMHPPQQMRQLPPGHRQVPSQQYAHYPPDQAGGMQPPPPQQYYQPTPGSQNTVGRAVLSQNDYDVEPPGMMVHDRRGVRMAGGGE